jgi:ribosomal protein S27AE
MQGTFAEDVQHFVLQSCIDLSPSDPGLRRCSFASAPVPKCKVPLRKMFLCCKAALTFLLLTQDFVAVPLPQHLFPNARYLCGRCSALQSCIDLSPSDPGLRRCSFASAPVPKCKVPLRKMFSILCCKAALTFLLLTQDFVAVPLPQHLFPNARYLCGRCSAFCAAKLH